MSSQVLVDPENHATILVALLVAGVTTVFFWLQRSRLPITPAVSELNIYPLKSCANIRVQTAVATELGFQNDRIAQVSDKDGNYCTPRDRACTKLFHVKPTLVFTDDNNTKLVLSAPQYADSSLEIDLVHHSKTKPTLAVPMTGPKVTLQDYGDDVASWLETVTSIKGCRLTVIGDGYQRTVEVNPDQKDPVPTTKDPMVSLADEAPYLLTSTSSLVDLNKRLKARGKDAVDMQRFRPNIVLSGLKPWEEDCLSKIRIGGKVEFHVWQRCGRCAMTTIDRESLTRGPEPLATLSTFREREGGQRNFGMHLVPVLPMMGNGDNVIRVGDKLEILEYDETRKAEWEKLFG
jgi:uncharacterized protein YcbX